MSHEFRTPLNSIIGFSEILIGKLEETIDPTLAKFQRNILRSGKHLLTLIDDILDLSKIEAGKMDLHLAPCRLADIVKHVCATMSGIADKAGVGLVTEVSGELPEISVDEDRIRQILHNLIANAVRFSEGGDRVTIAARALSTEASPLGVPTIELSVRDQGIGIKPEDQQRIFHEFQQVDDGLARNHGGTGLGLTLVKQLTEMHHGKVEIESQWGQGSTFRVLLPM
jgi:signal transduction histidine kinase